MPARLARVTTCLYTGRMSGYVKGTTAAGEIAVIRAAFTRAVTAIRAWPDPEQAFRDATELGALGREITAGVTDFRAWLVAQLAAAETLSLAQIASILGISKARAAQLARQGRQKGLTVTDPGTDPEPPTIALAVITGPLGVLIERRNDRIPPWTFPGGEIRPGESPAAAVTRRVPEETGAHVSDIRVLGRRIHPKTGRVIVYLAATADRTDVHAGDPEDLAEVKWTPVEEAFDLMPDMFGAAREHLTG
jgi:8-oxo-dGTP diphosphatase